MANEGPFLFYSALHGRPVRDPDGNVVGRLDDLAVTLTETFPAATALLVRRGRVESFRLTARWRDVESVDLAAVRLRVPDERLVPGRRLPSEPSFWIGQALLDRQIVDTSGAKVVRVNDLHFLHVPTGDLHLVHVDVGFRGLVRRLGWSTTMGKEQLISWRYVQPLTLAATGDTLQLTVTRKELGRLHPAELADILTELDGRERESLFRALAPEAAARALTEVEPRVRKRLIAGLPAERAADIVERMPPDEAADLLATLPQPHSELLLEKMERAEAADVQQLLRYEPDTAGGMMTTEFVTLPSHLTAAEALERLRGLAREVELIYYIYLVDPGAAWRAWSRSATSSSSTPPPASRRSCGATRCRSAPTTPPSASPRSPRSTTSSPFPCSTPRASSSASSPWTTS